MPGDGSPRGGRRTLTRLDRFDVHRIRRLSAVRHLRGRGGPWRVGGCAPVAAWPERPVEQGEQGDRTKYHRQHPIFGEYRLRSVVVARAGRKVATHLAAELGRCLLTAQL